MADVRSLLKSQRSARQVRHPHALYTAKGQLSCSLCRVQIKSEAQWEQHIRSEQHTSSLKRARAGQPAERRELSVNKKRKASDDEEDDINAKRVRSAAPEAASPAPAAFVDTAEEAVGDGARPQPPEASVANAPTPPTVTGLEASASGQSDEWEDELAAFDRDMEELDTAEQQRQLHTQDIRGAYESAATINVQPLTAAELAARDREEKSAQKRTARDLELEEEREEAAGQMQDEVERMNTYDEKIKALRARKEALISARAQGASNQGGESAEEHTSHEDDSDTSEDELDEWAFGGH